MVRFTRLQTAAWILGFGLAAAPLSALANTYFKELTGRDCDACHVRGREAEGKASLNPLGVSFMQCGYKFCTLPPQAAASGPVPMPSPGPPPGPAPMQGPAPAPALAAPSVQYRMATFSDFCRNGDSYFTVRTGVHRPATIAFILKNDHHVAIRLPLTATFTSNCGSPPLGNSVFSPVKFD